MSAVSVRRAGNEELQLCLDIREKVFVREQNVPLDREQDGLDTKCLHYLAIVNGAEVGTARVMPLPGAGKIQRVAVLPEARGNRVGQAIMAAILADLGADPAFGEAVLDSQTSAIGFYEALGFVVEGPEFMDAGIPHRHMRRSVA